MYLNITFSLGIMYVASLVRVIILDSSRKLVGLHHYDLWLASECGFTE
jgi:hypothetical protein